MGSDLSARLRPPTPGERADARSVVARHLSPTPVWPAQLDGRPVGLKLETAQPTGAFKVRGALAALASLPAGSRAVSASAGNHALGMAWAATRLGRPVTVVTATTASAKKVAALRRYAAAPGGHVELVLDGGDYEEAEAAARARAAREPGRYTYVSGYSDWAVIAGQASLGAELERRDGRLTVVLPLGGGGLTSGVVLWAEQHPGVVVVAVEPLASPAAGTAAEVGRIVPVEVRPTIADGLSGNLEEGCPTPAIIGRAVAAGRARIERVSEDEIRTAMRWAFAEHGLVVEGAGAAGLAAVLADRVPTDGETVVVLTGRNVSPEVYADALVR